MYDITKLKKAVRLILIGIVLLIVSAIAAALI